MTTFPLSEIIGEASSCSATTTARCSSFDTRLHVKLGPSSTPPGTHNNGNDGDAPNNGNTNQTKNEHFDTIRSLFRNAATALQMELRHQNITPQQYSNDENDTTNENINANPPLTPQTNNDNQNEALTTINAMAHWVPGRIEVMGKHTDYAGGNSLVCATAGRGMAMVSTMVTSDDTTNINASNNSSNSHNNGATSSASTTKVTIVSILPPGMESHATLETSSPFQINGRPVVHHTIHIPNSDGNETTTTITATANKDENKNTENYNSNNHEAGDKSESKGAVDWTIYPTAVVHRLHQNFGLYPHFLDIPSSVADTTTSPKTESKVVHIIIAMASNLPPASGLSTSSAFVTGMFLVLDSHLGLSLTEPYRQAIGIRRNHHDKFGSVDNNNEEGNGEGEYEEVDEEEVYHLSTYLGNVENGRDYVKSSKKLMFGDDDDGKGNKKRGSAAILKGTVQGGVGTFGGSEDHAAILMGRKGELRLLSFCPTRPASFNLNLGNSGDITISSCEVEGKMISDNSSIYQGSLIRLPTDVVFVIAYSGAKAEKAGGADGATEASTGYNCAAELARKALEAYLNGRASRSHIGDDGIETLADAIRWELHRRTGDTTSSRTLSNNTLNLRNDPIKKCISAQILSGASLIDSVNNRGDKVGVRNDRVEYGNILARRFEVFYDESEHLVPSAAFALSNKDYGMLGRIVDNSHCGAVNVLRNQIRETAWLPLSARGMEYKLTTEPSLFIGNAETNESLPSSTQPIKALAASAFGAGFGGSCWALVHRSQAHEFAQQWRHAYDKEFPNVKNNSNDGLIREFFVTEPGRGAFCV